MRKTYSDESRRESFKSMTIQTVQDRSLGLIGIKFEDGKRNLVYKARPRGSNHSKAKSNFLKGKKGADTGHSNSSLQASLT